MYSYIEILTFVFNILLTSMPQTWNLALTLRRQYYSMIFLPKPSSNTINQFIFSSKPGIRAPPAWDAWWLWSQSSQLQRQSSTPDINNHICNLFLVPQDELNGLLEYKRGSLESPVKSANIRFVWTFDLRKIRLKEQCVLIYALAML